MSCFGLKIQGTSRELLFLGRVLKVAFQIDGDRPERKYCLMVLILFS